MLIFSNGLFASQPVTAIKVIGPQTPLSASHDYFISLLQLVLDETTTEYGPASIIVNEYPGQGRAFHLLEKQQIDVLWSAGTRERAEQVRQINIPLLKGGLGWRGLLIRRQDAEEFVALKKLADFDRKVACQGMHWPDADILENAGLRVLRVMQFDVMLEMVQLGRCDYLPLSIFEGQAELDARALRFPHLMFSKQVVIQYPLAMYFYVSKDAPGLAGRLESGLNAMVASGKILNLMQQHPLTRDAFPLNELRHSVVLTIPGEHELVPQQPEYWLQWPVAR